MKFSILFQFIHVFCCIFNEVTQGNLITTAIVVNQGKLFGIFMKSTNGRDFEAFMGIPFGKVTKRFTAPEPADPWPGDFFAFQNGPLCPQFQTTLNKSVGKENCLTLNVFTPRKYADNQKLPVMVYIYGGAFVAGATLPSFYGPEHLMDKDIVLVAINYRLGLLGFLSTGDDAALGNWGLLDQQLALQWVQDNIEAFGGDQTKVTIFGHSAGAASVTYHLVSPRSNGLFHGAIIQSGTALCPWALDEKPLRTASVVAQQLGCPTDDTMALVDCMRSKSFMDISEISFKSFNLTIAPVVEVGNNVQGFLNEHPYVLMKEGRFNKVPIIIGVTLHESARFYLMYRNSFQGTKDEFFNNGLQQFLGNVTDTDFVDTQPDLIKEVGDAFFQDVDFNNEAAVTAAGVELASACLFDGCNDITVKFLAAQDVPVYSYLFVYISEVVGNITTLSGEPDVYHASDLPYLYNTQILNPKYSKVDKQVVEKMTTMWTNFATTFNPTPDGVPVEWKTTSSDVNQFLRIGEHMEMDDNFRNEKIAHWLPFEIKYLESQLE